MTEKRPKKERKEEEKEIKKGDKKRRNLATAAFTL